MSDDYSGELVEVEVARYGLRTFRHVKSSHVSRSPRDIAFSWNLFFNFTDLTVQPASTKTDDDTMELASTYIGGSYWKNGVCEATCQKVKQPEDKLRDQLIELAALSVGEEPVLVHQAPQADCGCGIYATHTLEHLRYQYPAEASKIVAVVAAEGQTIIGTKGFRTERARVVAYWCSDEVAPTAERQFSEAERYTEVLPMIAAYGLEVGEAPPQRSSDYWTISLAPSGGTVTLPALAGPTGPTPKIKPRNKILPALPNFAASAINGALFALTDSWLCLVCAILSLLLGVFFLVGKP